MIRFDRGNVGFGRHQTFSLRYGWLSKAFRAVERDPTILRSDIAIADLGVGKNMVESMGYWLRACRLVEPSTEVVPTELGQLIFAHDGVDPYLEDEATIWLAPVATATAGGMPMKKSSGVIKNPPPTPNIPERMPTIPPIPSKRKALTDTSAMGR